MSHLYGKEDIMPVTEKKYPDWVQKYRTRGKTVKKKGDAYYLYKLKCYNIVVTGVANKI